MNLAEEYFLYRLYSELVSTFLTNLMRSMAMPLTSSSLYPVFFVNVAFQNRAGAAADMLFPLVFIPLASLIAAYRHTAASFDGLSFISVQSKRHVSQRYCAKIYVRS
jgi:hypothetical protein